MAVEVLVVNSGLRSYAHINDPNSLNGKVVAEVSLLNSANPEIEAGK